MAFKKKLTLSQKKRERDEAQAKAPIKLKKGGDKFDVIIANVNKKLGGVGRVYRGSDIEKKEYARRSSGVASIDYVLCGGYPKGGLIEIGGEYSVGKTALAIEGAAACQRAGEAVAWIALEPFSKKWARERGLWIPFSHAEHVDLATGEMVYTDAFENASALELFRMGQAGIEDPYMETTPFVLVQEERGDVACDAAIELLRTNAFGLIVFDSLGVAKSTKWLEEQEVQDASDFPREPKMIGDYTTRALLTLNARYDDTNQISKDGTHFNQTTMLHLNHIGVEIGTQARTPWKKQRIKGGEGNKHNHHAIIFMHKGEQYRVDGPGGKPYVYGHEVRATCIKSKIGTPFLEGSYDFYTQAFGPFQPGDIDSAKDIVTLADIHGLITREGSWYTYGDVRINGREAFANALRDQPEVLSELWGGMLAAARR